MNIRTHDGVKYITFGECICKDIGDQYKCPHHGGYDGMGYCRMPASWHEVKRNEQYNG